ncbi:MAG: metallophosphoesterase family protein, partial [bacterium]
MISDVHANEAALRVMPEGLDYTVFMGDIVDYGPKPKECIQMIRRSAWKMVRGNHDNAVATRMDCQCSEVFKHLSVATREYMWEVLSEEETEFLRTLPLEERFELGGASFYLTHATPTDNLFQYLSPDVTDERLAQEMESVDADFIFIGHTHLPFV